MLPEKDRESSVDFSDAYYEPGKQVLVARKSQSDKYLTLDDLKKIVAFYESPVGKKLGASTPAMMAEGMQIGQKLGMEIATELQQELQAQGK